MPDGGAPLGERCSGPQLAAAFADAMHRYGMLQRTVAAHAGRLLELGIADMRPAAMARRFDEALMPCNSLIINATGHFLSLELLGARANPGETEVDGAAEIETTINGGLGVWLSLTKPPIPASRSSAAPARSATST